MVEGLSRGKALMVVLAASFSFLVIALFMTPGLVTSALYAVSAALFVFFLVLFVTWAKKTAGVQKGNFHELTQSVKRLEQSQRIQNESALKQFKTGDARLSQVEQSLKTQGSPNFSSQSYIDDSVALPSVSRESTTASLYAPGALPSSKVVKSNSPGAVGRRAASIETEEAKVSNLDVILNSENKHWKKNVAAILPSHAQQALSEKYNLVSLTPNRVSSAVEEQFEYVVIDERCSRQGQWAGFLETFKLGTYLELAEGLREARQRGAIVLVLEDPVSSSLTNSVRELADIRLNTSTPTKSKRYETLEIYRDVRNLSALEEQANV